MLSKYPSAQQKATYRARVSALDQVISGKRRARQCEPHPQHTQPSGSAEHSRSKVTRWRIHIRPETLVSQFGA